MTTSARTETEKRGGKNKLHKPAVEKKRRDHINTCTERLKQLLEDEMTSNSKLDKADILEMTVAYLKRCTMPRSSPVHGYTDGFAQCLQQTVCFFSVCKRSEIDKYSLSRAIQPEDYSVNTVNPSIPNCTGLKVTQPLWRPW
ncbi:transcription factor HES-5-like [Trichomycterus rosablanca]|uniref:transcription factor HES-5-like n=1 Tax=Trichomycterus rosablanca TaxID=2290929 RepID=UPI002F35EB1C